MNTQERQLKINQMKAFLEWLEHYPEIRLPGELFSPHFNIYGCTKNELITATKIIGKVDKHFADTIVWLTTRPVENIRLDFNASRDQVCERIVTGKKTIERQIIPAVPEKIIDEHEVDLVEWRCSPLLDETENAEKATEVAA